MRNNYVILLQDENVKSWKWVIFEIGGKLESEG